MKKVLLILLCCANSIISNPNNDQVQEKIADLQRQADIGFLDRFEERAFWQYCVERYHYNKLVKQYCVNKLHAVMIVQSDEKNI